MTDEVIIEEAIRLVNDGVSVTFPVRGYSMLPFIIGGRESVVLQKPHVTQVGDVVLAWVDDCRYVVHRVISISDNQVTLMGDGNIYGVEHCSLADVKALATHVVDRHGMKHDLYSDWRRTAAKAWWRLRPIRRYILAIYRRIV